MVDPFTSQTGGPDTGLTGRLLVSMPQLDEGPFAQAVVLICRHDLEHAFGVILNKPIAGVMARDAVAQLEDHPVESTGSAPVFFGGPCEPKRGFVLHSAEWSGEDTIPVGEDFGITGSRDALAQMHSEGLEPRTTRLIAGHAGWSPGQLDDELRRNYWLDMAASASFVFGMTPEEMWDAAIARIGISDSALSALGADASAGNRPLN